jgi:hypothetical protein
MNKNFVNLIRLNRFGINTFLKIYQLLLFAPNNFLHFKKCVFTIIICYSVMASMAQEGFKKYIQKNATTKASTAFYLINLRDSIPTHSYISIRQLDENFSIVKLQNRENNNGSKMQLVNDLWKLSSSLENGNIGVGKQTYIVSTLDVNLFYAYLNKFINDCSVIKLNNETKSFVLNCTYSFLQQHILPQATVIFVDKYVYPQMEEQISGYDRSLHQLNALDYLYPNSNGKNIVVGVKERNMDEKDIDIQKRIETSILASAQKDNHATSMATLIGGAGNSFYTGKGAAWKSNFFPSTFENLFADSSNLLIQKNISVQNHSYGTIVQAFYGSEALSYDKQTWDNKSVVHVFSSGNRGLETPTQGTYNGIVGYANITGNFKMAKNIIAVGAVDTGNVLAPFSSSGPTYDGRLIPHVVALGPNGTSDAAAIVSGLAAVLQQEYKDMNGQALPPSSLLKAILCNTADDIANKGIDYKTGYGSLNAIIALQTLQNRKYDGSTLSQNQVWTRPIIIPSNTANLKITLAYTDTAATINSFKTIVNDLDIELQEIATGIVYKPWCLSSFPHKDSLNKLPVRRRDSLNTIEQISIDLPNAGQYNIRVIGAKINTITQQAFHVAYNWDTLNTFSFINPLQAADVNREENPTLNIKWKTRVADTNTLGNFFISYNNGGTWQAVASNIKIYKQQCYWTIKDTNSIAKIKAELPFGTFFTNNFILSKLTKIGVNYVCTDSFQFSWPKHMYATGYRLYAMADSAYLKQLPLLITDTFISLKRSSFPYDTYAVLPLLNNNLPAARSVAIDINKQGVNCFYNTFTGNSNGNSIDLTLDLSVTNSIDSLIFEKLNNDGTVLRRIQKAIANQGQSSYLAIDNRLQTGSNKYRVKIYFKNSTFIYTEIISIISAGENNILLYPNPAKRYEPIQYLLKNTTDQYQLEIINMQGSRIAKYKIGISGSFTIPKASVGMYIYKLVDKDNKQIETGKLIIEN